MKEYHKIQTVFKRDSKTKFKTLLEGNFTIPEFEFLQNNIWIFTEKIDGTNIRIMFQDGAFVFGGKTNNASIPAFLVNKLNDIFLPLKNKFTEIFSTNVCLYGEGYGAKIQKGGGNYCQLQDFVLFDIKIEEWWLTREIIEDITEKLSIKIVPIIGRGTLMDMVEMTRAGFNSQWGNFIAEGIVARPLIELKARNGDRIITKIKYKDFSRGERK